MTPMHHYNHVDIPGLICYYYYEAKPTNGSFIFKLFSKGNQLKVKLANLKFSKIRDGP